MNSHCDHSLTGIPYCSHLAGAFSLFDLFGEINQVKQPPATFGHSQSHLLYTAARAAGPGNCMRAWPRPRRCVHARMRISHAYGQSLGMHARGPRAEGRRCAARAGGPWPAGSGRRAVPASMGTGATARARCSAAMAHVTSTELCRPRLLYVALPLPLYACVAGYSTAAVCGTSL